MNNEKEKIESSRLDVNNRDCAPSDLAMDKISQFSLGRALSSLHQLLEECSVRMAKGEFGLDDIQKELNRQNITKHGIDLLKLLSSLDAYKASMERLTGISLSSLQSDEQEIQEALSEEELNNVLAEFDAVEVFAEYREGDPVYDSKYAEEDKSILSELFFRILDGYLDPIVIGIRSLSSGNASPKLRTALLASIRPLRKSAESMGFEHLKIAFRNLEAILEQDPLSEVDASNQRILLIKAYEYLTKSLIKSGQKCGTREFLDTEKTESSFMLTLTRYSWIEGWMIQSLLEAGISSESKLKCCSEEELQAVTGMPLSQCHLVLSACKKALANQDGKITR